jgi:hypothetical protein
MTLTFNINFDEENYQDLRYRISNQKFYPSRWSEWSCRPCLPSVWTDYPKSRFCFGSIRHPSTPFEYGHPIESKTLDGLKR